MTGFRLKQETFRATELNEDTKDWMFKLLESNMKTAYQKVIAKRDLRCNLIRPSIYRVLWSINNDTPKSFLYE